MKRSRSPRLLCNCCWRWGPAANPTVFTFSYLSFELPPRLNALEATDGSRDQAEGKGEGRAIVILTARTREAKIVSPYTRSSLGDEDFDGFQRHADGTLPHPRIRQRETIGDQDWVHGRQFEIRTCLTIHRLFPTGSESYPPYW